MPASILGNTYTHYLYGDYTVTKIINATKAVITFKNTGYSYETNKIQITKGQVKDVYYKSVYGIACFGEPHGYDTSNRIHIKIYSIWHAMIRRCYVVEDSNYKSYGGSGITVCDRWHCFGYFFDDFPHLIGYLDWLDDPDSYNLDKDKLQNNIPIHQRVYSPETCCLITYKENNSYRRNTNYHKNNTSGEYIGVKPRVTMRATNYVCYIFSGGRTALQATFDDPYYAAVFRDTYEEIRYGIPHANSKFDIPIDYRSFREAQNHRLGTFSKPFKYEHGDMYHLIGPNDVRPTINLDLFKEV